MLRNSRHFTRVNYSVGASVKYGNNVAICNTDNLSLRGMYLKTEEEIPLDASVNITIYHSSQASLKFGAKVVRKESTGVGVQIDDLNANSFAQLRNLVAENSKDQGKIMQETYKMLSCIR